MKKKVFITTVLAVIVVMVPSSSRGEYSFGQWAVDTGLAADVTTVEAQSQGITSLDGLSDYPNIEVLVLSNNPITRIKVDDFAGMHIGEMLLSATDITIIETGAFSEMQNLYRLYLNDKIPLENKFLNWRGAKFRNLTALTIKDLSVTTIDLSFAELTQSAFDAMMTGGGAAFIGMGELNSISEINFTNADLSGVTQFNQMYSMTNLQTLNLANTLFAPSVISGNYQEVVVLANALEQQGILSFLTIDFAVYAARQSYWDDWDAQPLNELTVVFAVPGRDCTAPIRGDMNNDCKIDFKDLADIVSRWLECNLEPEDLCWQ